MSTSLVTGIPSTVVSALDDIDEKSKSFEGQADDTFDIGPFGVFMPGPAPRNTPGQANSPPLLPTPTSACAESRVSAPVIMGGNLVESGSVDHLAVSRDLLDPSDVEGNIDEYLNDLLASPIDFLQWEDLFAQATDLSFLDTPDVHDSFIPHSPKHLQLSASESPSEDPYWPLLDLTVEAPLLLRHFNDEVIDQMGSLPINEKSPWRTLGFPLALVTLSDLTVLNTNRNRIKHANLANFYALIAVSAFHLDLNSAAFPVPERPDNYWGVLSMRMYEAAKHHLHLSLETECAVPRKAKYKEQLISIGAILATAVSQYHRLCSS